MRVGILGRTGTLLESAKTIVASGHQIVFIVTCKAEPFYEKKEVDFKSYAEELQVPFFNTLDLISHADIIKKLKADICISINWLTIIENSFLSIFPYGVINAHAGDLPRYKGNACPNWAILNFENKIGLSIHKMIEELDSGPYVLKRFFEINETTYITDVYKWIESSIPTMFAEALDLIPLQGFFEQDTFVKTLRTYPRKPLDSRIIWAESNRVVLANIRASSHPFDGAFCFLNDVKTRVVIYRATQYEVDFDYLAIPGQVCFSASGYPIIATGDGLIAIEECLIEGYDPPESLLLITKSMRNRLI